VLPAAAEPAIEASTSYGSLTSEWPVTVVGDRYSHKRISGGPATAVLKVRLTNRHGDVVIGR
jgi:hypothetical protein